MLSLSRISLALLVGFSCGHNARAFLSPASLGTAIEVHDTVAAPSRRVPSIIRRASQKPLGPDEFDDDEEDEQERIRRDQFYRDLMGLHDDIDIEEQQQKSSKKKGKNQKNNITKRPHDNRDSLPFLVQVMTPPEEPYEHILKKTKKKPKRKKGGKPDYNDDEDDLGVVGETLGEFAFEKNTGSGDKIEIDNQIYLVQRATCQYRYAGAQKFVMVRKILKVKPIQRAMQEDYLLRQWNASPAPESE